MSDVFDEDLTARVNRQSPPAYRGGATVEARLSESLTTRIELDSEFGALVDDHATQTLVLHRSTRPVSVVDWGVTSSLGHRRMENEDWWGSEGDVRFAVADGMGGTSGGRLAAELAIREFLAVDASAGWVPEMIDLNRRIAESTTNFGYSSAGSTIVGLDIEAHRCVTVHVGDSRIYRLRRGHLRSITVDHNLANLRMEHGLDPDFPDGRGTPRALTSWIGGADDPSRIDVSTFSVEPGDRVVLVTDGVSDQLSVERIRCLVGLPQPCAEVARALVQASDDAGGRDNATALVVEFEDGV